MHQRLPDLQYRSSISGSQIDKVLHTELGRVASAMLESRPTCNTSLHCRTSGLSRFIVILSHSVSSPNMIVCNRLRCRSALFSSSIICIAAVARERNNASVFCNNSKSASGGFCVVGVNRSVFGFSFPFKCLSDLLSSQPSLSACGLSNLTLKINVPVCIFHLFFFPLTHLPM